MRQLASVLASVAVGVAILGTSVTVVLAARFSYPWFSAGRYNSHQLTMAQMQANYDRIIEYSLFPWVRELHLETLPMSDAGAQHFAEAKDIFQLFVQGGLIALVVAVVLGSWLWRRHRSTGFLTAGAIIALVTPLMLAVPLAGQFEQYLNARYLEREGYGMFAENFDDPATVTNFVQRTATYASNLARYQQRDNRAILDAIDDFLRTKVTR